MTHEEFTQATAALVQKEKELRQQRETPFQVARHAKAALQEMVIADNLSLSELERVRAEYLFAQAESDRLSDEIGAAYQERMDLRQEAIAARRVEAQGMNKKRLVELTGIQDRTREQLIEFYARAI